MAPEEAPATRRYRRCRVFPHNSCRYPFLVLHPRQLPCRQHGVAPTCRRWHDTLRAASNGFIGAFVAGLTLGNTERAVCTRAYEFGEAEGQLLSLIVFLIFGGVMVPAALPHWDWRAWLYALLSLSMVRMAPVALSLARSGLRPATLGFVGWFGPRGLASILYARIVVGEGLAVSVLLESTVVLTVLLSTLLHGVTAYPLARRYGERLSATREGAEEEHRTVSELPV